MVLSTSGDSSHVLLMVMGVSTVEFTVTVHMMLNFVPLYGVCDSLRENDGGGTVGV